MIKGDLASINEYLRSLDERLDEIEGYALEEALTKNTVENLKNRNFSKLLLLGLSVLILVIYFVINHADFFEKSNERFLIDLIDLFP